MKILRAFRLTRFVDELLTIVTRDRGLHKGGFFVSEVLFLEARFGALHGFFRGFLVNRLLGERHVHEHGTPVEAHTQWQRGGVRRRLSGRSVAQDEADKQQGLRMAGKIERHAIARSGDGAGVLRGLSAGRGWAVCSACPSGACQWWPASWSIQPISGNRTLPVTVRFCAGVRGAFLT